MSSDELHLSCSSSDFTSDEHVHEVQTSIEPYMFEPPASPNNSDSAISDEEATDEERLQNTDW